MTKHAKGTFEVKSWDEKPYDELKGGAKLTRASVTQSYQGDIEGVGSVEYTMMYPDENSASFVAMQRIVGRVGDKSGSFVLQMSGTFEDGLAKAAGTIVPGSGTGELQGVQGKGEFAAQHGESTVPYTLDYEIA